MTRGRVAALGATGGSLAVALCMVVLAVPGHLAIWSVPLLALAGTFATAVALAIVWRARRHSQLVQELERQACPLELGGLPVRHLEGLDAPFVAGLWRPRIYCGRDLPDRLTPQELRAVLLHERHHQLDRAPAKLVVLEAVAPLIGIFRAGRAWLAHRYAAVEIAADRYAIEHGASRVSLARALIRFAPTQQTRGVGFASAVDMRLRALLDGDSPRTAVPAATWLAVVGSAAAVCIVLVIA